MERTSDDVTWCDSTTWQVRARDWPRESVRAASVSWRISRCVTVIVSSDVVWCSRLLFVLPKPAIMSKLRSSTAIWLIGNETDKLSLTKLPSKREVMSLLMHYKNTKKQTVREALSSCAKDVMEIWRRASIPTSLKCHVIEKFNKIFIELQQLKKSNGIKSFIARNKEKVWSDN